MPATAEVKQNSLVQRLRNVLGSGVIFDEEHTEKLEEILIEADIGVQVTDEIIAELKQKYENEKIGSEEEFFSIIKKHMTNALTSEKGEADLNTSSGEHPTVILFVGVNGTGKTTSAGKLANYFVKQDKKVIMGAGDTFRAAAGEQLSQWAERAGADIVSHTEGGDPAAVVYDTVEAGIARDADYVLIDTAGRLHTKQDLMKQLEKINRVISKKIPDGPHEVLLVLDATAGQNGLAQAKQFYEDVDVTGIFLAKMDGTAKGGIIFSIKKMLGIPVKLMGIGEAAEDMKRFDAEDFVNSIFFQETTSGIEDEIKDELEQKMTPQVKQKGDHTRIILLCALLVVCVIMLVLFWVFNDVWYDFLGDVLRKSNLLKYLD